MKKVMSLLGLLLVTSACSTTPATSSQDTASSTGSPTGGMSTTTGGASGDCPVGQTACAAGCVDTLSDSGNCGGCGMACPAGTVCTQGVCGCSAGLSECAASCVNLMADVFNCGACGMACGQTQGCSTGTCSCPAAYSSCGDQCVDLQVDVQNCGACGTACALTQGCNVGACACPPGYASCGDQCLDTTTDVQNCGACGTMCASGQDCAAGSCSCQAGLTDCSGACLNLDENADNCGACGTPCAAELVCSLGACAESCAEGLTECDRSCADLQTSQANCGACGTACPAGQSCQAGVCSCAAGQTSCEGRCVNTATDLTNCGACGTLCSGGASCTAGACACPDGQSFCTGQCVDTQTNLTHCGACNASCSAGASCVAGTCSCPEGQEFCDGQCTDVTSNVLHCGACGNVCAAGECLGGSCPTVKDCAVSTVLTGPEFTDFEDYDGTMPVNEWGFSFNDSEHPVYAGPYEYNDETGTPVLQMVAGNGSSYAAGISNTQSSEWGAALGFWMGCIDASAYDGVSFWARGPVPRGLATLGISMEATSPPAEEDPAAGGTCTGAECVGPSVEFEVTEAWQQVLLPWSAFEPGSNGSASIPADGVDITGLTFSVNLEWVQDPNDEENYIPQPAPYDLAVDDIEFFSLDGTCPSGEVICGGGCVNAQTSAEHCGECNNACVNGTTCNQGSCQCPGGNILCNDECVDPQTSTSHCGECGGVCAIGATCSGGQCAGGSGTTSSTCGTTMTLLGNPFQCEFGWGANDEGSVPSYVDFVSKWVGYEQNIDSQCDGCGWLSSAGSGGRVPLYIAYFIAYRANIEAGYGDCNTDFDGQNLCTHGAAFIRSNRDRLVSIYESYARRSYQAYANNPVIWVVEPDMVQYVTSGSQTNPLSWDEFGSLMTDIICAIKSEMPNAVIAPNYSPWISGSTITSFWTAVPLDLVDLVHVTGMGNVPGGYINDGDANNREDGTYRYLNAITGKPIIVDTSFGVTTMSDTWSTASAATLNERIADGVTAALVYPTPGNYQSRIDSLAPQLNSTCQ